MPRGLIDFGTSRTAIAVIPDDNGDVDGRWALPARRLRVKNVGNSEWTQRLVSLQRENGEIGLPHVRMTSACLQVGDHVVVPYGYYQGNQGMWGGVGGDHGIQVKPRVGAPRLKVNQQLAESYIRAVQAMVKTAYIQEGQWSWHIGTSPGAFQPGQLATGKSESVLAALAVIGLHLGAQDDDTHALHTLTHDFILADLGGGFLDVAHVQWKNVDDLLTIQVLSEGAYPMGVDLWGEPFANQELPSSEHVIRFVAELVSRHRKDPNAEKNPRGMLLLLGGGLHRLTENERDLLVNRSANIWEQDFRNYLGEGAIVEVPWDTKEVTLLGLRIAATTQMPGGEQMAFQQEGRPPVLSDDQLVPNEARELIAKLLGQRHVGGRDPVARELGVQGGAVIARRPTVAAVVDACRRYIVGNPT